MELTLSAYGIAKALGLDETLIQHLLAKAGVKNIRPSKDTYTRKEVFLLVEYFIERAAMEEARKLVDFEKTVEFQMIPEKPSHDSKKHDLASFAIYYVPEPWLGPLLEEYSYFPVNKTGEEKEFREESFQVMERILTELRARKLID